MTKSNTSKHIAAFVYDVFPIIGILIVTSGITLIFRQGNDVKAQTWWFQALILCEVAFYYIYFWKIGGQTIGMKAWRISIVPNNKNLTHITWAQACLRFLAGVLSTALLGLGLLWKFFSKENKSWMDIVSSSHTVYTSDK